MKLLIAGGDARAAYAAHEAERRALSVSALGLENSPLSFPRASWEDVSQADAVLMANPWRTPFPGPLGKAIDADALIAALRPGTRLVFPDVLKNPPILILDEATSALDSVTEARIQRSFDELAQGRTSLIIAHRLSTIRNANRILVVENGRIAEEGTHEQLLAKNGEYARLYRVQNALEGREEIA